VVERRRRCCFSVTGAITASTITSCSAKISRMRSALEVRTPMRERRCRPCRAAGASSLSPISTNAAWEAMFAR